MPIGLTVDHSVLKQKNRTSIVDARALYQLSILSGKPIVLGGIKCIIEINSDIMKHAPSSHMNTIVLILLHVRLRSFFFILALCTDCVAALYICKRRQQ